MAEDTEVVEDEQAVTDPVPDEAVDQEQLPPEDGQEDAEQDGADDLQEQWNEVAPDLAEHIKDLSPEAREGILLKRLAAQSGGAPPDGDDPKVGVATEGQETRTPPVPDIPQIDSERFVSDVKQAFDDGDSKALGNSIAEVLRYVDGWTRLVGGAWKEAENKMAGLETKFTKATRPAIFRQALAGVRGAAEGDIAAAEAIMESGEATTPQAALSLAVFKRQNELAGTNKRKPGDDAKRRAQGVAASRSSGGSRQKGHPVQKIPQGEKGYAKLLEAAEE